MHVLSLVLSRSSSNGISQNEALYSDASNTRHARFQKRVTHHGLLVTWNRDCQWTENQIHRSCCTLVVGIDASRKVRLRRRIVQSNSLLNQWFELRVSLSRGLRL